MERSSAQLCREIGHGLGDFQLLRADRLTAAAADAGAGLLVPGNRREGHRRDEASAGEAMLIVQRQQSRNVQALGTMADGLAGFLTGGLIFWLVYAISRGGLGGGDVKLAATSGLYLGLDGVLSMMLYGSVLAASTGVVLILLKKIKPKDQIPLVPFLYVGILLTVFVR